MIRGWGISETTRWQIVCLLLVSLLAGCRLQPDLLRYGNRSTCTGYFSASYSVRLPNGADLSYGIPATPPPGLQLTWLADEAMFALYDTDNTLHLIDRSGQVIVERDYDRSYWPNADFSTSSFLDMYALFFRRSGALETLTTEIYSSHVQVSVEPDPLIVIQHLALPAWHPAEPKLAGIYYAEETSTYASNVVAIFDITQSNLAPASLFELDRSNIGAVRWSEDGRLIAVDQYRENGLMPVYLDVETSARSVSSFSVTFNSCAIAGTWSPSEHSFAFQGRTESTDGFDIFIEDVNLPHDNRRSVVTNLTNTPKEDEVSVSWSPDGRQVAYIWGYLDESGDYQQELARISMVEDSQEPVRLTDTPDEFETAPMWISAGEIAYLSWNHVQSKWRLKVLSMTSPDRQPETVMEIPDSWYRPPWDTVTNRNRTVDGSD